MSAFKCSPERLKRLNILYYLNLYFQPLTGLVRGFFNIKIKYNFNDENLKLINNIDIIANNNINVIIEYRSKTNKECFHNGIIRLQAKENVNVNITIINILNEFSNNTSQKTDSISKQLRKRGYYG